MGGQRHVLQVDDSHHVVYTADDVWRICDDYNIDDSVMKLIIQNSPYGGDSHV